MKSRLALFWPIPQEATMDPKLNRSCIAVLAFMTSFWWTTGKCFPLVETIQERCRMSRSTAFRCLSTLESEGWIKRRRRGKSESSVYIPGHRFTQKGMVSTLTPGVTGDTHSRSTTRGAAAPSPKPRKRRPSSHPTHQQIQAAGGRDAFYDENEILKPRPSRATRNTNVASRP